MFRTRTIVTALTQYNEEWDLEHSSTLQQLIDNIPTEDLSIVTRFKWIKKVKTNDATYYYRRSVPIPNWLRDTFCHLTRDQIIQNIKLYVNTAFLLGGQWVPVSQEL